jgi:Got1/Sft2-like family
LPPKAAESLQKISKLMQHGNRSIGVPMLAAGAVFTLLGVSLFFNKSLLRLGNILFIVGVPMTIGPGRTAGYFFQPKKSRATTCLVVGILLVLIGWPVFGMALEIFGILNLFGNMFPIVTAMLKTMPVIGPMLKGGQKRSQNHRDDFDYGQREDSQYYEEDDRRHYEERDRYY